MRQVLRAILVLITVVFATPAVAQSHLVVEGMLRDNAGKVLDGEFDVTFALYAAEDAAEALWTETHVGQKVAGGFFQSRLGQSQALEAPLFAANAGLWLGMTLADQPELPRTPLETDPYAFRALTAQSAATADVAKGLTCTGCVSLSALSAAVLTATNLTFDDTTTQLGATDVQTAIEKLQALIGTGGGGGGNEGAGTVSRYSDQWGLPSYGVATEYLHLMNPTKPKVIMHMYGGQNTGFSSSNNLIVSNTYQPNQYSGAVNGNAGDTSVTVANAGAFNQGDHILLHQFVGNNPGHWEINAVKAVQGNSLTLAKALEKSYLSKSGANTERAQVVIAASYNQLEVVNGGLIYPSQTLGTGTSDNLYGGVVYIRAQQISVKTGGTIRANGNERGGYQGGQGVNNGYGQRGDSECGVEPDWGVQPNCSGGGGGQYYGGSCNGDNNRTGGGGGNKTAGQDGKGGGNFGQGGKAKGDGNTLEFGGGGGRSRWDGARGGGIIVLGAKTIIVENGGVVQANGQNGSGSSGCAAEYAGSGAGAGGTIALFAENFQLDGTVEAKGGIGGDGHGDKDGGNGGDGWVIQKAPSPGIVNQSFATGVEIWIDGVEVTPSIGDPNGKGLPHYDAVNKKWGATGTEPWNTGPLDLTNVANWTLGEHKIEMKETGGAGGDLKGYFYVIQPFSTSKPPVNNSCTTPVLLTPTPEGGVVSGTTEDTMGKTAATDQSSVAGCGGVKGPDVVYRVDISERALFNAAVVAPFSSKLYLLDACDGGNLVTCADKTMVTNPIEAGTYYLWVDSDSANAKGNFTLATSITPAPLPINDTCEKSSELVFANGKAVVNSNSTYSLDDAKGLCPSALSGGPDVFYKLSAGQGQTLNVTLDADFESIIFVTWQGCGEAGVPMSCSATGSLQLQGLNGGDYWIAVDGVGEKDWGAYQLTVELTN